MSKWIKNISGSTKTYQGKDIFDTAYREIPTTDESKWANDSTLLVDVASGDVLVAKDDSGTLDITDVATAINFIKDNISQPSDTDGVPLARSKITQTGWHYQAHWSDFKTGTHNSVYNCDDFGDDLGFVSMRFFEGDGTELIQDTENSETDSEFQIRLTADCEITIMDWETDYNIDIIGATLYQTNAPVVDIRMWVIAVPFLTEAQGGSVVFGQGGMNLRYMGTGAVLDIDGKTAKTMYTNPSYHTNEFRIKVRHPAGTSHPIGAMFKIYQA